MSDPRVDETTALEQAFASFGDEVDGKDVPMLVEAGIEVWSWGYGDSETEFTTIDRDDLWFFAEEPEDAVIAWGPFRADLDYIALCREEAGVIAEASQQLLMEQLDDGGGWPETRVDARRAALYRQYLTRAGIVLARATKEG